MTFFVHAQSPRTNAQSALYVSKSYKHAGAVALSVEGKDAGSHLLEHVPAAAALQFAENITKIVAKVEAAEAKRKAEEEERQQREAEKEEFVVQSLRSHRNNSGNYDRHISVIKGGRGTFSIGIREGIGKEPYWGSNFSRTAVEELHTKLGRMLGKDQEG